MRLPPRSLSRGIVVVATLGVAWFLNASGIAFAAQSGAPLQKVRDLVIYQDPTFYAAFPSVVRRPDGELLVAFRRAPSRRTLGEKREGHVDPNSYLVFVRSKDGGATWTQAPELIYAHALGGSQDPCLLQLRDGTLLCASYGWQFIEPDVVAAMKHVYLRNKPGVVFLGGYLVRSTDGGKSWAGPTYPPHVDAELNHDAYGRAVPAYNRGAMYEGRDGRIFWVVAVTDRVMPTRKNSNHLLVSNDKGITWKYSAPVAVDEQVTFNEASAYETPNGDVVAFIRTANFDDQACIARSTDGGKTFAWQGMGFKGHPLQALRLPDQRVLLVYGYRHRPYGIRARILNSECTDFATAAEVVLREDGGTTDIGYPWAAMIDERRILVTYYFNLRDGPRHIAGTVVELP